MEIRPLSPQDAPTIWRINEEGLPGTGQVSEDGILELLELSTLPMGAYVEGELAGFVICLPPRTRYGSLNYAWFNENYEKFLYVDRIAVAESHRNLGIGSVLYQMVAEQAEKEGCPVAAEVSLKPPNPDSMRFHYRHGFAEVGVLHHEDKSVTMMLRLGA